MNLEQKKARVRELTRVISLAREPGLSLTALINERMRLTQELAEAGTTVGDIMREGGALTRQFGGTHYKNMGMQPVEFGMRNDLDPCAFSILKYVSRHRAKNGLQDVQKARHFVDLREEFIKECIPADLPLSMRDYIAANDMQPSDAEALLALEGWIACRLPGTTVARLIDEIMGEYVLQSA